METVIYQLLTYKSGQISSSQIEADLEDAIKKTLSDSIFRLQLGSVEEYWQLFNLILAQEKTSETCLINLLKLTRNVVAGNLNNQKLALGLGVLENIEKLLEKKMASPTDNTMILQVGTQAICNLITNNTTYIDIVWKEWMLNEERGKLWSYILSKSSQDLIMCVLVLIINCIRENDKRCREFVTSKVGKDMLAAILGDIERLHENQESKNFELGYSIFSELISFHYFDTLYTNIDDFSEKNLISEHQIILLKFIDSKLNTHLKSNEEKFPEFIKEKELNIIFNETNKLGKETVTIIQSIKEDGSSKIQEDQLSTIYTGIILLLQMLNELLILDQNEKHQLKIKFLNNDLLSLIIDILGHLESIKLPNSNEENPEIGFNFLKRECVRIVGTISYKDKFVQDKVRELDAIPLILSQLKIDDSNPYIREYATLALRNLLENNPENQAIIQELEPEKVAESKELLEMGYQPILKDGKISLKKV